MSLAKQQHLKGFQPNGLVLDAALCPEPLWFAKGAGIACHSLFNDSDQALEDNGPWLISLEGQDELIKLTLEKDTHGHSALWCKSELALLPLKKALERRLYAVKPDGETTRFRFYDPRVLHHYLSEETQARRDAFLEPLGVVRYASLNPFRFNSHWLSWQRRSDGYGCQAISIMED